MGYERVVAVQTKGTMFSNIAACGTVCINVEITWGMTDGSVGLGVKSKGTMSTKVAARGIVCMNVKLKKSPVDYHPQS